MHGWYDHIMRVSLTHSYLSPLDLRPKNEITKQDIDNRIENKLRAEGWKVDTNSACIECNTHIELGKILTFLKKNGISGGVILAGL